MSLFKTSKPTHKYHLGFTIIEAMVVMILVAVLAGSFTPNFLDVSKKRADIVMQDMQTIARAVQLYDLENVGFPEANNNCANAIATLTINNYITGIATKTTAWGLDSRYVTSCVATPGILSISVKTNAEWAPYIALGLPATISDGATSTMFISKLAFVPNFSPMLILQSSNTYRATGVVDMNKFALFNASPALKVSPPKRGIIVSSISDSSITPGTKTLKQIIGSITEFSSTQAIDSEITHTGASSYKYYRIQAVAEVTGLYSFEFTGDYYHVVYESERSNHDISKNGANNSNTISNNLNKGETIVLQIFHHSKNSNSNLLARVQTPSNSNFIGIASSTFFTIIDNKAKLLETNIAVNTSPQYAIFPIWAESTPTLGVGFNWSFGGGVDNLNGTGIVLDATAQLIAMTGNARGLSASQGYVVRARKNTAVATEDGAGSPQVRVSVLTNPSVHLTNNPSTYAPKDLFNLQTTIVTPTIGSSIAAAWFRKKVK